MDKECVVLAVLLLWVGARYTPSCSVRNFLGRTHFESELHPCYIAFSHMLPKEHSDQQP